MKHSPFTLIVCCIFIVFFAGCETIGGTDPLHDTTKLWPAYDNTTHMWGYINAKGKMVIPAQYDEANGFSCGYALVRKGNQSHYIDKHGAIQYSFNGTNCHSFHYNYAVVEQDGKAALVNKKFEYVILPGEYEGFGSMSYNGLIPAYCKLGVYWDGYAERQCGYANRNGELVVPCQYEDLSSFTKMGYAITSIRWKNATLDGCTIANVFINRYGIIDTNGNEVLPCTYEMVGIWDENKFLYYESSVHGWGICNKNGEVISAPEPYVAYKFPVDEGLIGVRNTESRWGYMDSNRTMKIDYQYDEVSPFSEGYAFVMGRNHDYEYSYMINSKGDTICTFPSFAYCPAGFHNGLALIGVWDSVYMYKYINTKGKIIYEWESEGSVFNSPADNTSNTDDTEGMQWFKKAQEFTEQTLHFSSARLSY